MSAIVVDLKDMGVRTPEQKVRVFFSLYTAQMVKELLWDAYKWYKFRGDEVAPPTDAQNKELILLFDHLVFLAEAIEALRVSVDTGKCVVCGRTGEKAG